MFHSPEPPSPPESLSESPLESPPHVAQRGRAMHRQPRRQKGLNRALRGFIGLMGLLMAAHAGLNIYASVRLNQALERARAHGEPLALPQLAPPAVPDAQNAALLYEQADKAAAYSGRDEITLENLAAPDSTPAEVAAAQVILGRSQEAVRLVRQASLLPGCRFATDWSQPPTRILFPQYAKMRRLARLMLAQAMSEARRGDTEAALRDARLIFVMSAHLQNEPVLIGFLVERALDAIANRAVARVIEAAPPSLAQARRFEASLPRVDWNASFRHAMLGERAFGLASFDLTRSVPPQALQAPLGGTLPNESPDDAMARLAASPIGALWAPVLKLDEAETLRLWELQLVAIEPMRVPVPNARNVAFDEALRDAPWYALMTKILFPVFSRVYQNRDAAEVGIRQRHVALALAAHRQAHGRYPAQLSQAQPLGAAMPQDLYAQAPLRYLCGEGGRSFSLYSIGPNRTDDRGVNSQHRALNGQKIPLHSQESAPATDDIVWNPKSK